MKKFVTLVLSASLMAVVTSAHAVKPSERYTLAQAAFDVNATGPYAGMFDTLYSLATGDQEIASRLTGNGQYTVFAPTDDAFEAVVPLLVCNNLFTPELVNSVLKYHIVRGNRDSTEVLDTDRFRTLLGAFFEHDNLVITDGAGEDADIIAYDVFADNGVIHAVNKVLLPFPIPQDCPAES